MLNLKIKYEKHELHEIYFFRLTQVFCFPDIMFRESALFGNFTKPYFYSLIKNSKSLWETSVRLF